MEKFDPLTGHEIHSTLKDLLSLQGRKELNPKHFGISPSHAHALGRIFKSANDAKLILSKLYPEDVDPEVISELNTSISSTRNELRAFVSNGNPGHIDNARQHTLGGTMPNLKRLIPIGFQVHPRTESALEAYRAKAQSANAELNAALRESSEILKKIQTEISYSTSQLSDLQSLIAASKAESERLIADLRQSDLDRVERQTKEAQGAISAVNKKLNQFVDRAGIEIAESVSEWQVKAEESLKDLNQRREEARGIVQSVGEILTTGTYADRASTETDKADKFRNITIGLFVIGLLIILSNYIIYAIAFAVGEKVALAETWQALTARLVTGLAVALPAFYTARESARHRTNADTAKQRELEISTLGPFIELLPEEQKSAIRERLTDRYFGNKIEPHVFTPPYDADALTRSLVDLVRRSGGDAA